MDLVHGLDEEGFATIRRALDDHSILIFPGQPMDDEQQIAFSAWWGPMEPTKGVNPASGTPFARQSNLDIKTGEVIPPDDRRMSYQTGNYQWHDSTRYRRLMQRTTIGNPGILDTPIYQRIRELQHDASVTPNRQTAR